MTDQVAMVTFTTPTAAGTLDVTHPSITDTFTAAILIFTRETTDDANNTHAILGVGFIAPDAGATTQEGASSCRASGTSTAVIGCQQRHNDDRCINALLGSATTVAIEAEYSASIAGGVTLNFTTVAAGPIRSKCTAILFAGWSRAFAGSATATTGGTANAVGGSTNFEPSLVVFTPSDGVVTPGTLNDASPGLGFAVNTGGLPQVSAYQNWDTATEPTDADGEIRSAHCYANVDASRAAQRVALTAFTATGFNLTSTAGTCRAHYLALKPAGTLVMAVDNVAVSGSTGVQSFNVGIQPQAVFGMSTLFAAEDTQTDGATAGAFGIFAFTSSYERAYSAHNREGISVPADFPNQDAHTRQTDKALLTLDHQGTVAQEATFSAFTATGFDLNFSTATAGFLTVLAIGAGTQTLVSSDTEQISDGAVLNLRRSLVAPSETVRVSDGAVLVLADGLSDLGPAGSILEACASRGTILDSGGATAGWIMEAQASEGTILDSGGAVAGGVFG